MEIEKISSVGSESSITSIASGSDSKFVFNENCETTIDASGVGLKVRKPYTISKQREKWTEEEHQKFIEALKLYGRAWRQIEEYIGTKTAVQIRSHAQKFFTKVMKEGTCSSEASVEPVEIPPPRPKRKPLHPYPRKLVDAPNNNKKCPGFGLNGTSTTVNTSERDEHSPFSVLSPEGSQIFASHATAQGQGIGCVSRASSGSNLSYVVKDTSTKEMKKENEENFSLNLNLSGPSMDDSTFMSARKMFKDVGSIEEEDNYSQNRIRSVGEVVPLKSIKLFGHTMVVANQSEYSDGMNNMDAQLATGNQFSELSSKINNNLVGGPLLGKRPIEKEVSNGFSCTGSNSNSFNEFKNPETNHDSVDSKINYSQQANVNPNNFRKGFYPYKRCTSDRDAVHVADDRENQRIRVYL